MTTRAGVLFDLDGTLLDTARDFHRLVNHMLAQADRPPIAFDSIRTQVSNGARAMVCHAFELSTNDAAFPALHRQLLDDYAEQLLIDSTLFPGMPELLTWLDDNDIPWGIVTNKPARFTLPLLAALGLDASCGSTVCPEDVTQPKPDPEGLLLACQQLGVTPEHSYYVGDHIRDIEAGKAAGMATIAAGWGYLNPGETPQQWHSDHVSEHSAELQPLLHSLLQAR
ncbi:HAD family hydrolase [Marinobacterium weihaiense]|uniref:HAD-IA family hydrolase n=1 Tax=Marinobacterium weihaiense TaxID=2851016 RepID=A0ABS6MAV8_9GAMM|nr:HAD-IA family hydrolase [Marinobacterium weihaiense]MBV0933419.1 HAD-IA family hydrolase [Marinobacterium weihaiense]